MEQKDVSSHAGEKEKDIIPSPKLKNLSNPFKKLPIAYKS